MYTCNCIYIYIMMTGQLLFSPMLASRHCLTWIARSWQSSGLRPAPVPVNKHLSLSIYIYMCMYMYKYTYILIYYMYVYIYIYYVSLSLCIYIYIYTHVYHMIYEADARLANVAAPVRTGSYLSCGRPSCARLQSRCVTIDVDSNLNISSWIQIDVDSRSVHGWPCG